MTKQNVFQLVLKTDKHRCQVWGCGCTQDLEVHHIIPRSQGGLDVAWNLITLCSKHHRMITEGKLSDIEVLEKLKKKSYFRWWLALAWHQARNQMKKYKLEITKVKDGTETQ